MRSQLQHPEFWRGRAAWALLMAEHHPDLQEREHQLRLATIYQRLARYAAERIA
jgi:hypothetical protein